jgi:hypothetical protein
MYFEVAVVVVVVVIVVVTEENIEIYIRDGACPY